MTAVDRETSRKIAGKSFRQCGLQLWRPARIGQEKRVRGKTKDRRERRSLPVNLSLRLFAFEGGREGATTGRRMKNTEKKNKVNLAEKSTGRKQVRKVHPTPLRPSRGTAEPL